MSALKLQDRTILLTGPFNSVVQALLRTMTEFGCDIALVSDEKSYAGRFCEGLNDLREARPDYGRAAHFQLPMKTDEEIREALARVAETFGRMDVLIDAHPLSWNTQTSVELALSNSLKLAEAMQPFFKAKHRGRVIYIFEDESLESLELPMIPAKARESLLNQLSGIALASRPNMVTVNGLAIGVTEDYLLTRCPKASTIRKSLDELKLKHPTLKLVESTDVALGTAYLASGLSGCLTGQVLRLTHGFHLR